MNVYHKECVTFPKTWKYYTIVNGRENAIVTITRNSSRSGFSYYVYRGVQYHRSFDNLVGANSCAKRLLSDWAGANGYENVKIVEIR